MIALAPGAVRLTVRVQPRASRSRVIGRHGETLKVQVTAPPVDGAANAAVVALLAEWLGTPPRAVRIVQGAGAREKLVEVASDAPAELAARIERRLAGCVDKDGGRD